MTIKADFTGAYKKLATLYHIPDAARFQMERFGAQTTKELKLSVRSKFSKGRGRRTGHLFRNIAYQVNDLGNRKYGLIVGTGISFAAAVKYATIQDKGGTVTGKNWKTMTRTTKTGKRVVIHFKRPMLAIPQADGSLRLAHKVKIPASHWFSDVIKKRRSILKQMMSEDELLKVARRL